LIPAQFQARAHHLSLPGENIRRAVIAPLKFHEKTLFRCDEGGPETSCRTSAPGNAIPDDMLAECASELIKTDRSAELWLAL
jgi:hypothetical protein